MAMTDVHPGTSPAPARPGGDLTDVLADDHRTVCDLLRRLSRPDTHPQRRRDLLDVTVAELARHAMAETRYLYPAVRDHLAGGGELVARALAGQQRLAWLMTDLMNTDLAHPGFEPLVRRLADEVRTHVREHGSVLLPRVRAACRPADLAALGTGAMRARRLAPTRPHPTMPTNRLIGSVVALFDQAVDALTDRPTSVDELSPDP
jgi:hypothetical protein